MNNLQVCTTGPNALGLYASNSTILQCSITRHKAIATEQAVQATGAILPTLRHSCARRFPGTGGDGHECQGRAVPRSLLERKPYWPQGRFDARRHCPSALVCILSTQSNSQNWAKPVPSHDGSCWHLTWWPVNTARAIGRFGTWPAISH